MAVGSAVDDGSRHNSDIRLLRNGATATSIADPYFRGQLGTRDSLPRGVDDGSVYTRLHDSWRSHEPSVLSHGDRFTATTDREFDPVVSGLNMRRSDVSGGPPHYPMVRSAVPAFPSGGLELPLTSALAAHHHMQLPDYLHLPAVASVHAPLATAGTHSRGAQLSSVAPASDALVGDWRRVDDGSLILVRPDGSVYDPAGRTMGVKPSPVDFRGFDSASMERAPLPSARSAKHAEVSEHVGSDPGGDAQFADEYESVGSEELGVHSAGKVDHLPASTSSCTTPGVVPGSATQRSARLGTAGLQTPGEVATHQGTGVAFSPAQVQEILRMQLAASPGQSPGTPTVDSGGPYKHAAFDWAVAAMNAPSGQLFRPTGSRFNPDVLVKTVPAAGSSSSKKFWANFKEGRLLTLFKYGISDAEYGKLRAKMRDSLCMIAYTERDAAQGEGVAEGVLLRALEHYRGRSSPYSSLAHIAEHYAERSGMFTKQTVPQLRAVLYDMDHRFCQPTADAAREDGESRFDGLRLRHGVQLDDALRRTEQLCAQRYADADMVRTETLYHFRKNVKAQAEEHKHDCLMFACDIVEAEQFVSLDIDSGVKKLRTWLSSNPWGRLLVRLGEELQTRKRGRSRDQSPVHERETEQDLSRGIHALRFKPGFDDAWVALEGVPGFPAPSDKKYPLAVCKIYTHMGQSIPSDFPTHCSSSDKVGALCFGSGCKKIENWYYHPNDTEFQTKGGGRARPKGESGFGFDKGNGWIHNGSRCHHVWADVHRWVKAHPEDKWMFNEVKMAEAFARPERR